MVDSNNIDAYTNKGKYCIVERSIFKAHES